MSTSKDTVTMNYIDAATGEPISIVRQVCKRYGNSIPLDGHGHNECRRAFLEEEAEHMEKLRQQECILKFGRVVSRQEETWMTYPDSRAFGYNETYNQHLKRIEAEQRQAYFHRRAARTNRREKLLPETRAQLKYLEAQVPRDEQDQIDDDKAEEERLKKKGNINATKQQADLSLRTQIEEENDTESQLQEYVKARGIQ